MKYKKFIVPFSFFSFLLIFFTTLANAKTLLSFNDCIKEAKENNAELQALKFEKDAVKHQILSAKANYNPSLDANAGAESNKIDTGPSKDSDLYNWNVSLSQNIFSGFLDEGKLESAYASQAQNIASIIITESKISAELKTAFSAISYWQKYLDLSKKIVQRRKENYSVVKLRYEAGNENKGSFLKAKAQLDEANFEEKQAKRKLDSSKYELAKILGRNSTDNLFIKGDVPHTKIKIANSDKYMKNHPQVLLAKANVALAKADVKVSESSVYPSLDATLKTGGQGGSPDKSIDHSIGVNVSMPISTFGRNKNNILQAKSLLSSAVSQEIFTNQEIKSSIKSAKADLESAMEKVDIDKNLRNAAEVRAEIGRSKYNIGLLTFENWDIIENDLISYQKSELSSQNNLIVSEANWEQALGLGVLND